MRDNVPTHIIVRPSLIHGQAAYESVGKHAYVYLMEQLRYNILEFIPTGKDSPKSRILLIIFDIALDACDMFHAIGTDSNR